MLMVVWLLVVALIVVLVCRSSLMLILWPTVPLLISSRCWFVSVRLGGSVVVVLVGGRDVVGMRFSVLVRVLSMIGLLKGWLRWMLVVVVVADVCFGAFSSSMGGSV